MTFVKNTKFFCFFLFVDKMKIEIVSGDILVEQKGFIDYRDIDI